MRLWGVVTPEMAEAMAIKEALSWSELQTWQNIEIESDCLVVIQSIRSKVPMVSQLGVVIEECRALLKRLNSFQLFFVKRSVNMVAHSLARMLYSLPDRIINGSDVPVDIKACLLSDLSM